MQTFIKLFPAILLLLIAGFYLGGQALPGDYTITSEIQIEAPPEEVYGWTDRAEDWRSWFTGPEGQVTVESEDRLTLVLEEVKHVLELTETSSPTSVRYQHFADAPGALEPVRGHITIGPSDAGSTVRIQEQVSVSSSTQRWLVFLFGRSLMAQVLDRELHNLKSLVETGRVHARPDAAREPG